MSKRKTLAILVAILAVAAGLRIYGIAWGLPDGFHPDERMIVMTAGRISAQDPNPRFFAYGSLPIYLLKGITAAAEVLGVRNPNMTVVGRLLSAAAGTATVLLLFLLARALWSVSVGLIAAAFLGVAVTHIQNSHYYTADVPLTFFTLLSLLGAVRLAEDARPRWAILAGVGFGMALATKISAAPLLLPLVLATVLSRRREGGRPRGALLASGLVAAAVTAIACEPYAILDFTTFLRQVTEQGNMATGRAFLPYTLQFKGTAPYLYPVGQLVRWSLGIPLGIAAVLSTLVAPALPGVRRRGMAILYAFLLPFFLINASLFAKYPRYLLPVVPLMLTLAAAVLVHLGRSRHRIAGQLARGVACLVLLAAGAYALAFLNIYRLVNPRIAASDYLYTYFPGARTILTEHWDDRVPVTTARGRAEDFTYKTLPLYEPDTEEKWRGICKDLAEGDLVVLSSLRLAGSIPRDPLKYPVASSYYRTLLAGDLGYGIEAVFTTYPSLLGWTVRDNLADESIRVYDHPTVVILAKRTSLSADQIRRRIAEPSEASRRWTLETILSIPPKNPSAVAWERGAGRIPDPSHPTPWWRWGGEAFALLLLVGLSGPLAYPLLFPLLTHLPDRGWAAARVLGPFLFGTVVWAGAARGWWGFTPAACWGLAAVWTAASWAAARCRPLAAAHLRTEARPLLLAGEGVFWGSLLLFLLFKAFNPAVFWGEKPMNLSYLESLMRSSAVPPPDPWFAGSPLNYYYLGHFFVALPAKMLGMDPTVAFNVASAVIPAMVAVCLFSLTATLTGKRRWGLVAVAFAAFLGNAAGVAELVARANRGGGWGNWARWMNFDYFWAPSRVIPGTINEFPFWSFLFSDLHAHLLVMPVWCALLLLGWHLFRTCAEGGPALSRPLLLPLAIGGIAAVATYGINPWSLPGTVLFLLLAAFAGGLASPRPLLSLWYALTACVAVVGGAVLFLPYLTAYTTPVGGIARVGRDSSPLGPFLTIWAYLLAILLAWVIAVAFPRWARAIVGSIVAGIAAVGIVVLVPNLAGGLTSSFAAAVSAVFEKPGSPAALLLCGGLALVALVAAVRRGKTHARRYALLLALFGAGVLAGSEVLFIDSRFNTVFKFHLQAWFPLACAAAVALSDIAGRYRLPRAARIAVTAAFVCASAVWFQFVVTGTRGKLVDDKSIGGRLPTLDGMEFMRVRDPSEWQALTWLRRYAGGTPVVAEAAGPPYREFTRVAMYTGLPSVLGWDYHLTQQNRRLRDIERRKTSLEELYAAASPAAIFRSAGEYAIRLVYVGGVERQEYGPRTGESFDGILPLVFSAGDTAVYEARSADLPQPAVLTDSPALPADTLPAAPADMYVGGRGRRPGQFNEARGLDVTPEGDVLIADFRNGRFQRFGPDGSFKAAVGRWGSDRGEMKDPMDVAAGGDGRAYLLDSWNNRVQVINPDGSFSAAWEAPPPGFYGPRGIAWSPGAVAVTDTGNNRVVLFSLNGTVLRELGTKGDGVGELQLPVGVAFDGDTLVVVDSGNNRLALFDLSGRPKGTVPVPGWSGAGLKEGYVTVDGARRYLVTDPPGGSVIVIASGTGAAFRIPLPGADTYPTGIAHRPDGTTLVMETHKDRVVTVKVPVP